MLVEGTKAKYSIYNNNIGVIGLIKVVTGAERRAQPKLVQPGDWEWVTVIQSICAAGYATPPFIIYKGRIHISA
ncbi:uncharacterized protein M421DRAFT_425635 [Didymella exigua CBS 183.55]